jgi:hypothetical protein
VRVPSYLFWGLSVLTHGAPSSGDIFRHLGKWRQAEVNFRMAYSIDPLDRCVCGHQFSSLLAALDPNSGDWICRRHLADMLSEVTAKASLAASPDEYLLPIEWKVSLFRGLRHFSGFNSLPTLSCF